MPPFTKPPQRVVITLSELVGRIGGGLTLAESSLTFDASVSETHSNLYDITAHPVESGVDITDHKQRRPRELVLTLIQSDDVSFDTSVTERLPLAMLPANNVKDAWERLKEFQAADSLVSVITTLEKYDNLAIVGITAPRDATRGNILEVTVDLKEVILVVSATVDAKLVARPASEDLTKKATTTRAVETDKPRQTAAANVLDTIFGG